MKTQKHTRASLGGSVVGPLCLIGLLAAGCAEPTKDINYVQPGYVAKAIFDGDWYYRETITKSDPTLSTGGFVGAEAELEKIHWEIQEDQLIAYRTHEVIPGIDEDSDLPGADYKGEPVAVFKIDDQFDIKRDYNASTGEQSNTIRENTSDRPWYEREYIRFEVMNSLPSAANVEGWTSGTSVTQDWFDTERMYSPDQPVVEDDYLEFTTQSTFIDRTVCAALYGDGGACSSGDVNIRHSFLRIDPDAATTYEPKLYPDRLPLLDADGKPIQEMDVPFPLKRWLTGAAQDSACTSSIECGFGMACVAGRCGGCTSTDQCAEGEACVRPYDAVFNPSADATPGSCSVRFAKAACTQDLLDLMDQKFAPGFYTKTDNCSVASIKQFERFGFFRTERPSYNRETGRNRDDGARYFANLHPIWQKAQVVTNGVATPIPMKDRLPRPIVYYLNVGFPDDLKETAYQIAGDWNVGMMGAVVAGTGREQPKVEDQLDTWGNAHNRYDQFVAADKRKYRAMFQIRENTCSLGGLTAYLTDHPSFYGDLVAGIRGNEHDQVSQIRKGDEPEDFDAAELKKLLKVGNLERGCSTLRRATLDAHVTKKGADGNQVADHFEYQRVGDIRYNFLNWVNEQQPSGPLGYGPSSTDAENGRVISANANIYGAGLDNYARNSVDVIRVINGDLAVNDLLEGKNIADWLARTPSLEVTGTALSPLSQATADKMDERRASLIARIQGTTNPDGTPVAPNAAAQRMGATDAVATAKNLAAMANLQPVDPNYKSPGRQRFEAAMRDPEFAARMVPQAFVKALAPLFNQGNPVADATPEQVAAATLAATDLHTFTRVDEAHAQLLEQKHIDMFQMVDDAVIGKALELRNEAPEDIYKSLRKEIFRGVTLHEIGHTLGLTHNFEGSYDALNYHDEYWQKLHDIKAGAAGGDPDVEDRLEARIPEYTYSTIMDYHGRFNSDQAGLGKYDRAAMTYAYGNKVEVFGDNVRVPAMQDIYLWVAYFYGNDALPSLFGDDYKALSDRKLVDIQDLVKQRQEELQANAHAVMQSISTSDAQIAVPRDVPYAYCEHTYLFRNRCKQFDQGASNAEVVHNSIQRYWNYYFFNSFRRGRNETPFVNNFFGRESGLLDDMSYAIKYYVYGNRNSPLGRDFLQATLESLNFVNMVMGTPTPGRHCLDAKRNVFVAQTGEEDCEKYVDIPEGMGRDQFLKYDDQYVFNVDYLGTFFDKWSFIFFLLDDSTNFFNVTNFGDSRRFAINYYRLFRPEMVKMARDVVFSYLGAGDNKTFGPVVDAEGKVHQPVLVDPQTFGLQGESPTAAAYRVDSASPPELMWRVLGASAIYNSSPADGETDFLDYMLIFEDGSAAARALPPTTPVVKYIDPVTHVTYVAPQTEDELSISYEMLTYFNTQTAAAQQVRAQADANPDDAALQAEADRAEAGLGRFSDLLDDFRLFRADAKPYDN